ncbi:MAG: hypothetical protein AB1589_30895 [Cyanobacteriota bacterium]
MPTTPNQRTYDYNGKEVAFDQLPATLQADILESEDFWSKYDNASTEQERKELLKNHPYNK